jgi:hypothetical protein
MPTPVVRCLPRLSYRFFLGLILRRRCFPDFARHLAVLSCHHSFAHGTLVRFLSPLRIAQRFFPMLWFYRLPAHVHLLVGILVSNRPE